MIGFSLRKALGISFAAPELSLFLYPNEILRATTAFGNLLIVLNINLLRCVTWPSKRHPQALRRLTVITWIFISAASRPLPIAGTRLQTHLVLLAERDVWLAVLYIILMPTVGAYYLNAWAASPRVESGTVAVYIYLQPLIAFASR